MKFERSHDNVLLWVSDIVQYKNNVSGTYMIALGKQPDCHLTFYMVSWLQRIELKPRATLACGRN